MHSAARGMRRSGAGKAEKSGASPAGRRPDMTQSAAAHTLARKTFRISRLAEFASVAELVKQTGHPVADWPLVIVKELVDNALDEAEEAGFAPVIEIVVTDNSITVTDKGRGIAPTVVASLVDY